MAILLGNTSNTSPLASSLIDGALLKQTSYLTVHFRSGEHALLEAASPLSAVRARVIDELQNEDRLIYVETDNRNVIT